MKSVLLIVLFITAVSIACSASRSDASPPTASDATQLNEPSTINASSDSTTQGKPACSFSLSEAPPIKGLRLGMTADEVLALFPGSKDDAAVRADLSRAPSRFGSLSFVIRPSKYEGKEKFSDVSQISFTMLDGRVSDFTVSYNGPQWPHVDKFVTRFVEGTNLPPADQWQAYEGLSDQMKTLTCAEFEIRVFAGGEGGNLNYVSIRDLEADKNLKARRAKSKESPTPQ